MSMNKVIIEDVIAKMAGKTETELRPDQSIRFETPDADFTVRIANGAIEVRKIGKTSDQMQVLPVVGNVIKIY